MQVEVIPAILSKTRSDLLSKINSVSSYVNLIQLDIMDGFFVPNKTVGLSDLTDLPPLQYEFHWMVNDPINWIKHFPGPHIHLVHIETIPNKEEFDRIESLIKKQGGQMGLAINPPTPIESLLPFIPRVSEVLIMTVNPGFSGQKYIYAMESRLRLLRSKFPKLTIEVDGGVNLETIHHAYQNGANYLAAASAIFSGTDIGSNIVALKKRAIGDAGG